LQPRAVVRLEIDDGALARITRRSRRHARPGDGRFELPEGGAPQPALSISSARLTRLASLASVPYRSPAKAANGTAPEFPSRLSRPLTAAGPHRGAGSPLIRVHLRRRAAVPERRGNFNDQWERIYARMAMR